MRVVLFDNHSRNSLTPFTYNHAIAHLRLGICTIAEWWQILSGAAVGVQTVDYLQRKYPIVPDGTYIYVDASVIADEVLTSAILNLSDGEAIVDEAGVVAAHVTSSRFVNLINNKPGGISLRKHNPVRRLVYGWQMFMWNDELLRLQFNKLKTLVKSISPASTTNTIIGNADELIIEDGAVVEHATINLTTGPVYIGKGCLVMEGGNIRGPFAMNQNSVLKMGAKIYGATTLGPSCVVGGEVKNCILQGYSNKAHDGYLGDSVIGQWCNLGAGTSNSNLKNTAGQIRIWNEQTRQLEPVGNKGGVMMGDYTRTAINTSITTGSFYGVCCNIMSPYYPPTIVPNFSWLAQMIQTYKFDKAMRDIDNWMQLKQQRLSDEEKSVLQYIFAHSKWESKRGSL